MLKLFSLSNIGLKGLNSDAAPWSLSGEFITHGLNFRIDNNTISSSGGYSNWSTPPVNYYPGLVVPVLTTSGVYWLLPGRTGVYAFDGSTWTNIDSVAGYAGLGVNDELNWTGCKLGSIPIINNPQHVPEYWSPQSPGQIMQPLQFDAVNTWAAKGYSFKVIRSHKNWLFALNLQEGVNELPDSYRWSTSADINGLPFTWDEADTSALAGKAQISGNNGAIVDGLSLRDSFCIYSETGINVLDSTNDEFVWRRRELSTTAGLLARKNIVEVKGTHFILSDGDILTNDGNSINSIIHNRLRRRLNAEMSIDYYSRSFAVRQDSRKEVWFCVPERDAKYPNVAYIYNWKDDSWAIRDLPETPHIAYGAKVNATETWDDWEGTWDSSVGIWGSRERTPGSNTLIGINQSDGSLKVVDTDDPTDSGDIGAVIERTDFPLEGHRQVTSISAVYPHIEGTEPVEIQIGSQDKAGGAVRWQLPKTFTPGQDRKLDVRTTGKLHTWRIKSIGTGHWRLSGMDIEYQLSGVR